MGKLSNEQMLCGAVILVLVFLVFKQNSNEGLPRLRFKKPKRFVPYKRPRYVSPGSPPNCNSGHRVGQLWSNCRKRGRPTCVKTTDYRWRQGSLQHPSSSQSGETWCKNRGKKR